MKLTIRRDRTLQQRSEFWNDCGVLVYIALVAVGFLVTFVFMPATVQLIGVIAAMLLPIPVVLSIMQWRHRQYMRSVDSSSSDRSATVYRDNQFASLPHWQGHLETGVALVISGGSSLSAATAIVGGVRPRH